jgi:Dolichyl-phosphate-mannose-protein mannosyltransferase
VAVAEQLKSCEPRKSPRDPAANEGEDSPTELDLLPLWFERGLVVATAGVLSFGGFGLLLAVVGQYSMLPAFAVGTLLTVLVSTLAWPRRGAHSTVDRNKSRAVRYPAIGMCIMALGFAIWNGIDAGQHVAIGRDPGVYAVTSHWIATHGNLEVPTHPEWTAPAGAVSVLLNGTYVEGGNRLEFQFNHLMPVLLAEADNLGSDRLLFRVPALLGALALCAVYAAGCRLVRRPWLVLAAVGTLALSLPQLNVSRDTYSEPSVQLLLWSGLWLMLVAYQRKRFGMAVVAGAALGGTLLSRVDALVYLIPLPLLGALVLLAARSTAERRHLWKMHLGVLIGAVPVALLGTFDVIERAGAYYTDLHAQMRLLQLAMAASVLAAVVLLAVWPRLAPRAAGMTDWVAASRQGLAITSSVVLVVGLFAAWMLRPAAMTSITNPISLVAGLQRQAGLKMDPTRAYSEYSITWISWYIGPIAVTLAIIGVGLVAARMWRRIDPAGALLLSVAGFGGALYLWKPSITPDQIWAMRRFVPAMMPLMVLLAALSIAALGHAVASSTAGRAWQRPVVTIAAIGMLMFPLGAMRRVAHFEAQTGVLSVVQSACKTVGPRGAIAFAADDPAGMLLSTAVRTWCDVPVAVLTRPQSTAEIQQIVRSWQAGGRTLWVVGSSADSVAKSAPGINATLVASATSPRQLEMTIQRAPQNYSQGVLTLYAGPVAP